MNDTENMAIKTNLQFKEHTHFFDDYFELRKVAFNFLAKAITDDTKIPDLYQSVLILVEYTSTYISNVDFLDEKVKNIDKLIVLKRKDKNKEAILEIKKLLRLISSEHESSELLPQKRSDDVSTQKFWKEEEHKALRNMKKAFHDIFFLK